MGVGVGQGGADPYPTYRRLQRDFPVAEIGGFFYVYGYQGVNQVLRHPEVSADDRHSVLLRGLSAADALAPAYLSQLDDRSFLHSDPPDHTRLRRLAAKGFTPKRIQALRGYIQSKVDDVVDDIDGTFDAVDALAYPLPIDVICELLGIPAEDREIVADWPRVQLCCSFESITTGPAAGTRQVEADRIQQQLTTYFDSLIERRRRRPGNDLISDLIAAEESGDKLSHAEINATLRLLFVAGYENVVNLIGNGLLALLRDATAWDALAADPSLAASTVDEVMRYDAPFQFTRRVTLADIAIDGYAIPKGSVIAAFMAAANRDPKHFDQPDRFNIHRSPNPHLGFGTGIHACMGGPLARMEAEIVFTTLTRRLIDPVLMTDPPQYRTDVFRSLKELPITARDIR